MKNIELTVKKTLKKINLSKKEKLLVALSGGKDSSVCAYILKKFEYNIIGFHINLGMGEYSEKSLEAVKKLSKQLGIKLYVYDLKKEIGKRMLDLKPFIEAMKKNNPNTCAVCGVIKKSIMNKESRKLKANKLVTGHNLDDEVQTFLINFFKGSLKLSSNVGAISQNISDKKFIPRIKPLFYVPENLIKDYSEKMNLPVVNGKCPYAGDSYRIQLRDFVNKLNSESKKNIIENFEKITNKIKKLDDSKINYCEICGEPCRGKICKSCKILNK